MRVHSNSVVYAECAKKHHIRGLAGNSGQGDKLFHASGNLAGKIFGNKFRGGAQILRFLAKKANGADDAFQLLLACLRKLPGPGPAREQVRRNHVHPRIGALGRQNHGHEQFPRILVKQGGWRVGIAFGKNFLRSRGKLFGRQFFVHGLI